MQNYFRSRLAGIIGIIFVAFVFGVLCGHFLLKSIGGSAVAKPGRLSENVSQLYKEVFELRRQIAIAENSSRVDRLAEKRTTQDLLKLQEQLTASNKELEFFRRIISPDKSNSELRIQSFKLFDDVKPRYVVHLTQGIGKNRIVKGVVHIQATGYMYGGRHVLSLMDFDSKRQLKLPFSFKYFQSIEGEVKWPDGFQLESMQIWLKPETKGLSEITKSWTSEELKSILPLSK